jgi:hypothetical protein
MQGDEPGRIVLVARRQAIAHETQRKAPGISGQRIFRELQYVVLDGGRRTPAPGVVERFVDQRFACRCDAQPQRGGVESELQARDARRVDERD